MANAIESLLPRVTITLRNGATLTVVPDGNSYLREELLRPSYVELRFTRFEYVELPLGSTFTLDGRAYTLYAPAAVARQGEHLFEYTARFESDAAAMGAIMALNPVDGRAAFTLTATPREHARLLIDNMNTRGGGGWALGECLEAPPREVSYSAASCLAALAQVAQTFETEWRCDGKTLHLCRVGHGEGDPVELSYGPAGGLKPGLQRQVHAQDGNPVGRLFVQGGERNIDFAKYGAKRLHLPKGEKIRFDGNRFEGEAGFTGARAVAYLTDASGASLRRADTAEGGVAYQEASHPLEEVYPSYVGTVSEVEPNGMDFYDKGIPDNLNFRDARIPGEKATVIFQTGMLAGREVDVEQTEHDLTGYDPAARRFRLVPIEEGGVQMPSASFPVRRGDKYAVFHVALPGAYIEMAERELLKAAVRYLHPRAGHRYTVRAELDPVWAREKWGDLGGRLALGGYVAIQDKELFGAGAEANRMAILRVVATSRRLDDPYSPRLELSNEPAAGGVFSQLARARAQERVANERADAAVRFSRRGLADAREGLRQLDGIAKRMGDFEKSIRPATVTTMGALVGSEMTNFRFLQRLEIAWRPEGKTIAIRSPDTADGSVTLRHATLGLPAAQRGVISCAGATAERDWRVPAVEFNISYDDPCYLYAFCRKAQGDTAARFAIRVNTYELDANGDPEFNLLVALVSSPDSRGQRSVQTVYGVTEVTPGSLRTNRIISGDGKTYFDLEHGEIGGRIRFTEREYEARSKQWNHNLVINGYREKGTLEEWRALSDDGVSTRIINVTDTSDNYIEYSVDLSRRGGGGRNYFKFGQVWGDYLYGYNGNDDNGEWACIALHIRYCNRVAEALCFEGYWGGGYPMKYASELRDPARREAMPNDILRETLVWGPIRRENGSQYIAISWVLDRSKIKFSEGEEVIKGIHIDFYAVKIERGKAFTGWHGTLGEYGFTALDGGQLRTYGIELMKGSGPGAKTSAGLYGGGSSGYYSDNMPAIWAGGTFADAATGTAATIFRHDGSAKIGPLTTDRKGLMTWLDNNGLFTINPTGDMPSLGDLLAKRQRDISPERPVEAVQSSVISVNSANLVYDASTEIASRKDSFSVPLRLEEVQIDDMITADSRVEVTISFHVVGDVEIESHEKDIGVASAFCALQGTLYLPGRTKGIFLMVSPNARENATSVTARLAAGDKFSFSGKLEGDVYVEKKIKKENPNPGDGFPIGPQPPDGDRPGIGWLTPKDDEGSLNDGDAFTRVALYGVNAQYGFNRSAHAKVANARAWCTYTIRYSAVPGQQKFIIARNGFALVHSGSRYIYCDVGTNTFEACGLNLKNVTLEGKKMDKAALDRLLE